MGIFFGPVGAVLLSAALLYVGNGLLGLVLPLRGVGEAFPTAVLGLMGSAYSGGFILGCLFAPRVIRRVGHIRAFAVFAAVTSSAALLHAIFVEPTAWLALRLAAGASLSGMFMVIESWLNERADNSNRGRILGATWWSTTSRWWRASFSPRPGTRGASSSSRSRPSPSAGR